MSTINSADAVFVYTGEGGGQATRDVVRVRVDPAVTSIPASAFYRRKKLTEVELCEGLVEIGVSSFMWCDHSIRKINIPISLRRITGWAFARSLRCPIHLHDGIESIGEFAFAFCIFTNFRVPPLITVIPNRMLNGCRAMFSVELSKNVTEILDGAFYGCYCLRNVAFPPNAIFGDFIFSGPSATDQYDLYKLFGSEARFIRELQHRFDGLPIHKLVYYQSYHRGVLQNLVAAINLRSGQRRSLRSLLNPTGNQQDCLGMTPLHILACSTVHNIEVYRLIVEKYPANLITEDRWGALPLLYAFWGAAPSEIIEFLLDSYKSLYPDYVLNWTTMVKTMGRCDIPIESITNLLNVRLMHFHDQSIDWEYLLDDFAELSNHNLPGAPNQERMQFLFTCGMSERVGALPFKVWRDHITNMIHTVAFEYNRVNLVILQEIQEKLAYFDYKLPKLKEATTILELALWKVRMTVNKNIHQGRTNCCQKKVRVDESSFRSQCRVTCGADVVIGHVLPYLL